MELDIYTDGSYMKKLDRASGSVIILQNDSPIYARRYIVEDKFFRPMQSPGAELYSALASMYIAAGILIAKSGIKSNDVDGTITFYHDYVGIAKIPQGEWPNLKKAGTVMYLKQCQAFKKTYPNIKVKYVWTKGHSGIKWNEAADALASGVVIPEIAHVIEDELVLKGE